MSDHPEVRLTSFSHGAGCACKLSPDDLSRVLELLGPDDVTDERLLVGYDTADDAGVFLVRDDLATVFTADFFTPVVDDPYDWGRIAAANALSDVYAMGGDPIMALNLVAWPREGLDFGLLGEVLRGGRDVAAAAGAVVVGGHSVDDAEPKYGMAVVGTADPERLIRNGGGRAADALVLTKPLGTGVISTALKRDGATSAHVEAAVALMTTLNADAARVAHDHRITGGTDVTGFGLLGHLRELASASGCAAEVVVGDVPVLAGVRELIAEGMVAGGTKRNRDFVDPAVDWGSAGEADQFLLSDAQTSGGLLLCVPAERLDALVTDLESAGTPAAAVIGRLTAGAPGTITLG